MLDAAAALLGPDIAQTFGAADAGRVLALLQVADEVGLADEGTGGGDEVDAGVQDLLGGLRAADPAHQDQGDGDRLTDLYGPVQIEGGDLFLAEAQPVVAGQLNGIGTQGFKLAAEVENILGIGLVSFIGMSVCTLN